jgi:hypothetical protein
MKALLLKLLTKRFSKVAGGGIGAILAAIGGITSIQVLQPAVEKASDYAAKTVELYCELPEVDRIRFRTEVMERLLARSIELGTTSADVRVSCPLDTRRE